MPYLLTDYSNDEVEDGCIGSVTFCTNISSINPIKLTHSPFSSSKWCHGIHPSMVLECVIMFTVSSLSLLCGVFLLGRYSQFTLYFNWRAVNKNLHRL